MLDLDFFSYLSWFYINEKCDVVKPMEKNHGAPWPTKIYPARDLQKCAWRIPMDLRNVWLHVKECVNTQPQVGQGQAAKLLGQTWALLTWNAHSRLGIAHDACHSES